ncbi:hypothetical protein NSQ62_14515 [Solibacillus sp. FSL H8-0523]|uniref:hypothetical protein n=1 Tax=Solibacillus sp. FSL H8-0523 TaxID=2954511 RepID=UPI003100AE58
MKPTLIGYNGPPPLAIIFWYEAGEDEPSYKTVCYDEQDVEQMYKLHTAPVGLYSTLRPSVHLVDSGNTAEQAA